MIRRSDVVSAALLGLGGGLRAFAPPVGFAIRRRGPLAGPARFAVCAVGAGELIADKLPQTPSRWNPLGMVPRLSFSSAGGRELGGWPGAGVAAAAAVVSAYVGSHLRVKVQGRPAQLAAALAEDALSYGLVLVAVSNPD